MTKEEFIQEAALRILARDGESSMISIADYAAELAAEVWNRLSDEQPEQPKDEPVILKCFSNDESVNVVANEIGRIEKEEVKEKNEDLKARGLLQHWGAYQASGADVRFSNVCEYYNIKTVPELINYGRAKFRRCKNMGEKTICLVDKALESLYDIKSW